MKKLSQYFLLFILSTVFFSGFSHAQQESGDRLGELFTIYGVEVNEVAANAAIARKLAISKAESIAFDTLKTKLVAADDLHLLANTDFLDIKSLVSGIEVNDERAFSNRYMAKIDISFNPEAIIEIFNQAKAAFILNAGSEICVAHGHKEGLVTRLWEEDNLAKKIWISMNVVNRLRTYKIAQGSLIERGSLSSSSVEIGGFEIAQTFANGCGTGAGLVLFTHAVQNSNTGEIALRYSYWISDTLISKSGIETVSDGQLVETAIMKVIQQALDDSDEGWRQTSMIDGAEQGELLLLVNTDKVIMLSDAKKKLSTLSLVNKIDIVQISIPLSQLNIHYTGSHDQLMRAFSQVGYRVINWGQENLLVPVK